MSGARSGREGAATRSERGTRRILIVEDSPTMRQLLAFALRGLERVEIVEAVDGMDALRRLRSDGFDLALVDIHMPVMDGLKLIAMMKGEPELARVPVVVITTEGNRGDRERALALGADAYLSKPVKSGRVLEIAEALLKGG